MLAGLGIAIAWWLAFGTFAHSKGPISIRLGATVSRRRKPLMIAFFTLP
jgi:hypothetical protein